MIRFEGGTDRFSLGYKQLKKKKSVQSLICLSKPKTSNFGLQKNLEFLQKVHKCIMQISFQEIYRSYWDKMADWTHIISVLKTPQNYSKDKFIFICGDSNNNPQW